MKANPLPTIERLKELLNYCQDTGEFTWVKGIPDNRRSGKKAGSANSKGYIEISIDGISYKAHRLAWLYVHGIDPGESEIDHRDLNKGNNAIDNLRLVTRKQNNENIPVPRNNTTGVRGVGMRKRDRSWTAYIYHNKCRIHLGSFKRFEQAVAARQLAEATFFTHSSGITKKGEQ